MLSIFSTVVANRDLISGSMNLQIDFEIPHVAYFNFLLFKVHPSINTQPALGDFWWYGISVLGPFRQPGQCIKKGSGPILSNFLGRFFHVLGGKKNFEFFFKNILGTALKSYIKWLLYFFFIIIEKI